MDSRAYYQANREKMLAKMREDYPKRRKKILAYQKQYYKDNTAKVVARVKAYHAADPVRTKLNKASDYQKHKESRDARADVWRKDNPDIIARNSKRRALRLSANGGSHTRAERKAKFAEMGDVCFYCNQPGKLETDHDIPVCRGGSSDISNIYPACKACNVRKHTMTTDEYILWRST